MARIFISYSRKDEPFARDLARALSDAGADVWIDVEDIPAGMKWSTAIQQGLDLCELMIVILTPASMASSNVEDEWQFYLDEKKPIIPVLRERSKVHFQLSRIQYIDFLNQPFDTAFAQLHAELRRKGLTLDPLTPPTPPVAETPPAPTPAPPDDNDVAAVPAAVVQPDASPPVPTDAVPAAVVQPDASPPVPTDAVPAAVVQADALPPVPASARDPVAAPRHFPDLPRPASAQRQDMRSAALPSRLLVGAVVGGVALIALVLLVLLNSASETPGTVTPTQRRSAVDSGNPTIAALNLTPIVTATARGAGVAQTLDALDLTLDAGMPTPIVDDFALTMTAAAAGGALRIAVDADGDAFTYDWRNAEFSPDGERVTLTGSFSSGGQPSIWSPDGTAHVWLYDGVVFIDTLHSASRSRQLADNGSWQTYDLALYVDDNSIENFQSNVYFARADANDYDLYYQWTGSATDGTAEPFYGTGVNTDFNERLPAPAPDGQSLAFMSNRDSEYVGSQGYIQYSVYLYDFSAGTSKLDVPPVTDPLALVWSADSAHLALSLDDGAGIIVYSLAAGTHRLVTLPANAVLKPDGGLSWSPDGQTLAFVCRQAGEQYDLCLIGADGGGFRRMDVGAPVNAVQWLPAA